MFTTMFALLLATAAALPTNPSVVDTMTSTVQSLNSTPWDGNRTLLPHEVLLFGHDGIKERMEIVHRDVYKQIFERGGLFGPAEILGAAEGILSHAPAVNYTYLNSTVPTSAVKERDVPVLGSNEKRCNVVKAAVTDTIQTFVDWDVQMSPVVAATAPTTSVTVASGYSLANSVSVGGGVDYAWIKSILSTTFKINYSATWTTSYTASVTYVVPVGEHATIVTNPTTTVAMAAFFRAALAP